MEFGLRRAQGPDAGLYGARAAMIGGCVGTSNVLAGQMFDVPVMGTHAHSWIMSFPDEYTAFKTYAEMYPDNCTLLVATYDTLKSGVPNAIRVFQEFRDAGKPLIDVYKRQFLDDRLDHWLSDTLDRRQTITDIAAVNGEASFSFINIRWKDLNSHLSATVNVL